MENGEGEPACYESLPPELIKKIVEKSWPFGDGINKATQKAYEEVKREKLEEEYLKRRVETATSDDKDIGSTVRMSTEGAQLCAEYASALRSVQKESPPLPCSTRPS
eukprot:jgi/Mesvir1/484/Mv11356-RA.1